MQVGTVDNCTLTKEQCPYFTQDIDYQNVLNQIKAAVAREIFAEIEYLIWQNDTHPAGELTERIAELKKKYESEKDNGNDTK